MRIIIHNIQFDIKYFNDGNTIAFVLVDDKANFIVELNSDILPTLELKAMKHISWWTCHYVLRFLFFPFFYFMNTFVFTMHLWSCYFRGISFLLFCEFLFFFITFYDVQNCSLPHSRISSSKNILKHNKFLERYFNSWFTYFPSKLIEEQSKMLKVYSQLNFFQHFPLERNLCNNINFQWTTSVVAAIWNTSSL